MDKIWDRNPSKSKVTLAVVTGRKPQMTTQNRHGTRALMLKNNKIISNRGIITFRAITYLCVS